MIERKSSFLDNFPRLKAEWHYEENEKNGIYPENLSFGSHKKVFWKCESGNKCHVWEAVIHSRTKNKNPTGCPLCTNQKICPCGCNSLWSSNPELREEWNEEKNGDMKLYAPNSGKKVFWKCKTGNKCHVWESTANHRTNKKNSRGCPFCVSRIICSCGCNSLWGLNPELREEWDEKRNGNMKLYAPGSDKKVVWICKTGNKCHVWEAVICSRTKKKNPAGCPLCTNLKICPCGCNSLWATNPELREEWDEKRNGSMKLYAPKSGLKVFWKCKTGNKCHVWKSTANHRTKNKNPTGCPLCTNLKICSCGCNSLWASNPELREEWDEKRNGSMKLYAPGSGLKVFWKCKTGNKCHVWETVIGNRTKNKNPTGCPLCVSKVICLCGCNSLWASNPELREEWDEKRNGSMKLYAPNSNEKAFWKCVNNKCHIWETIISTRTKKKNPGSCPYCRKSKLEKMFSTICSELDIEYEVQKRYKDCKDVKCLPYDFFLPKYNICVELQGIQHFQCINFFHKTSANYLKRLITDSKKVKSAYDRGDSFLSISHLVETQEEMTSILKNMTKKVKKARTIRFQITSEIYFDAFSKLSIPIPTNNKLLLVYEIYDEQRKMIEDSFGEELEYDKNLIHCPYCDEHHLENYIVHHYQTKSHYRTLKKIYENLVGMGKNGVPIVLENNLNLEL